MKRDLIKQTIFSNFVNAIEAWNEENIYSISFFVYDYDDNPCKPTVSLSYNTEEEVRKNLKYFDESEARWNYACWSQNVAAQFGYDKDSSELVRDWILENNLPYKENYNPYDTTKDCVEFLQEITNGFVEILIEVVKEIHKENILIRKFKRSIPILIHELEYYDAIGKQNIDANGEELVKDFTAYIDSLAQKAYEDLEKYLNIKN